MSFKDIRNATIIFAVVLLILLIMKSKSKRKEIGQARQKAKNELRAVEEKNRKAQEIVQRKLETGKLDFR